MSIYQILNFQFIIRVPTWQLVTAVQSLTGAASPYLGVWEVAASQEDAPPCVPQSLYVTVVESRVAHAPQTSAWSVEVFSHNARTLKTDSQTYLLWHSQSAKREKATQKWKFRSLSKTWVYTDVCRMQMSEMFSSSYSSLPIQTRCVVTYVVKKSPIT